MLNWIQDWVAYVLKNNSLGSELESYINSKNPKTPGDVEYWTNQYFLER